MDSSDASDGSNRRLHDPLPSIHHVSSRLSEINPARSRTDPPAPVTQHQKSQLHRRLGSNALRNKTFNVTSSKHGDHTHSRRQHAKDAVQSAMELKPPISFDHLLRRDKKTSDQSRADHAAPVSQTQSQSQSQRDSGEGTTQQAEKKVQSEVTLEQVRNAKRQNAIRESELRESLRSVEETAMSSTRQLDDTYYTILEKVSLLRSTLASLQQLADESKQMRDTFESDSSRLEENMREKFDSFQNFDVQEQAVDQLVSQLTQAKEKTDKLNQRLENAWTRVEKYEEREKEKEDTRRKRWRWSSLITFVILAAFTVVITSRHRIVFSDKIHGAVKQVDELGGDMLYPVAALLKPLMHREEDPHLRELFDEL